MAARVTRAGAAPAYHPPLHDGVQARRLQGHEAGPTERFWVGLSRYAPGGTAQRSAVPEETVYTVLDGELVLVTEEFEDLTDEEFDDGAGGVEQTLGALDSVHLPRGTVRSLHNRSGRPATLLVVIATPAPADAAP